MPHKWIFRPVSALWYSKTEMEFYDWHHQPSTALVITAASFHQWNERLQTFLHFQRRRELRSAGSRPRITHNFMQSSVFHWATFPFHELTRNVQIQLPRGLMFSFSSTQGCTRSKVCCVSVFRLYSCNQIPLDPVWMNTGWIRNRWQ